MPTCTTTHSKVANGEQATIEWLMDTYVRALNVSRSLRFSNVNLQNLAIIFKFCSNIFLRQFLSYPV